MGLANIVYVAEEPQVKLVDGSGSEDLGITEGQLLRLANSERVKTGNARAALAAGIGIVQSVIVDEIVSGDLADARVGVDVSAGLVVPHGFRVGGSGELVDANVGCGNVLEQMLSGSRPDGLRNDGAGKNALGARAAAGRVIRLTLRNGVAQFARELIREVGAAHRSGQGARRVAEIAGAFRIGEHRC